MLIFAIIGFISWRIWAIPIVWILNKVARKQYGVIEIQSKGNKILTNTADFTKDFYEKDNRLFNLAAAKENNLVFYKYGVPHVHFDEHDTQPKPFHPQRETDAEKARNSSSVSNLVANLSTFFKRFAMSFTDKRLRVVLIVAGAALLVSVINMILIYLVSQQVSGLGTMLAKPVPTVSVIPSVPSG
jgi:hypothetical protein